MLITVAAARPLAVASAAGARRRGPHRLRAAQPAAAETAEEGGKPLRVSMVRCVWALRRRRRGAGGGSAPPSPTASG